MREINIDTTNIQEELKEFAKNPLRDLMNWVDEQYDNTNAKFDGFDLTAKMESGNFIKVIFKAAKSEEDL